MSLSLSVAEIHYRAAAVRQQKVPAFTLLRRAEIFVERNVEEREIVIHFNLFVRNGNGKALIRQSVLYRNVKARLLVFLCGAAEIRLVLLVHFLCIARRLKNTRKLAFNIGGIQNRFVNGVHCLAFEYRIALDVIAVLPVHLFGVDEIIVVLKFHSVKLIG